MTKQHGIKFKKWNKINTARYKKIKLDKGRDRGKERKGEEGRGREIKE